MALRYLHFLASLHLPHWLQYPAQLLFLYIFIHIYLFYILCASLALVIRRGVNIRGDRLYPSLPELKDKLTLWITTMFIFHWLSTFMLGSGWSLLTDWIFAIRPQINIKPQVKVLQQAAAVSTASSSSNYSFSMEDATTDLDVGLVPDHPATRGLLKNVQSAQRSISTASDLYHAMASDSSCSNESTSGPSDMEDD